MTIIIMTIIMTIMCTMQIINESLNIDDPQDARFALDKDEQTTFIDSQGKLNPKAVKWSEVKKKTSNWRKSV